MQFKSILARHVCPRMAVAFVCGVLSAWGPAHADDMTVRIAGQIPAMRWDARPEASTWTSQTLAVVAAHDAQLAATVPADIATFCPHYPKASLTERRAFWVALLSATAKHESGFNPKAVGGGGRYIGLMQISPSTARNSGCQADTASDLKDGTRNLECAIKVFAPHVAADGMVAGGGNRGIGRDWGPYRSAKKRGDIAGWTARQSYCQA